MSRKSNNVNVDVANFGTEVTFHAGSGVNTATQKYLSLHLWIARKVVITSDKLCSLLAIDGDDFDDAREIGAATANTIDMNGIGGSTIESVKVRIDTATTHVEVLMLS